MKVKYIFLRRFLFNNATFVIWEHFLVWSFFSIKLMSDLRVKIFSDVACPWCWVGLRRFQEGVKLAAVKPQVEFHAFMLDPSRSDNFEMPLMEYLANERGFPSSKLQMMTKSLNSAGEEYGCVFNFDRTTAVSTLNAHRLVHYARENGKSVEVKEKLFEAYFKDGKKINSEEVLLEIAEQCGLDKEAARTSLKSEESYNGVQADLNSARSNQINGVPFFIINDRYAISGAQDPSEFASLLKKATGS